MRFFADGGRYTESKSLSGREICPMKKAFLLLCALLLVLGSALPLAGYRLARAVLGRRADVSPAPASSTSAVSEAAPAAFEGDADVFLIEDLSIGEV